MPAESLDYPSSARPASPVRCAACGSHRLVHGKLAGDVAFKPDSIAKFFHVSGTVSVDGMACVDCGVITFIVDRDKLVDLAGR